MNSFWPWFLPTIPGLATSYHTTSAYSVPASALEIAPRLVSLPEPAELNQAHFEVLWSLVCDDSVYSGLWYYGWGEGVGKVTVAARTWPHVDQGRCLSQVCGSLCAPGLWLICIEGLSLKRGRVAWAFWSSRIYAFLLWSFLLQEILVLFLIIQPISLLFKTLSWSFYSYTGSLYLG